MSEAIISIKLDEIMADEEFNCRGPISPVDVADLARSIEQLGRLIQPVSVSALDEAEKLLHPGKLWKLMAGFRRFVAHRVLNWTEIKCIVVPGMTPVQAKIFNLVENLNRVDLSIVQEAKTLQGLRALGCSEVECATKLGKSRGWVQIRYMLLALPSEIQEAIEAGFINQTNIRELYMMMSREGAQATMEAAKALKEAKQAGFKGVKIKHKQQQLETKRQRNRSEIQEMLGHISTQLGFSLVTRGLAWASGEISSSDLFEDLRKECEARGKVYVAMPTSSGNFTIGVS
jgi:ParB/RepB/Spo0J family partition protein